jgi:hypothetical protein
MLTYLTKGCALLITLQHAATEMNSTSGFSILVTLLLLTLCTCAMWWLKPAAAAAVTLPGCSAFVPPAGGSAAKHHSQSSRHARLDDSSVDSVSEGLGKGMQVCFTLLACAVIAFNAIAAHAFLQYMYKCFVLANRSCSLASAVSAPTSINQPLGNSLLRLCAKAQLLTVASACRKAV